MKERPILFSAPMVRSILDGSKTQTRRIVKSQPPEDEPICAGLYHPSLTDRHGEQQPGAEVYGAYTQDGEWALPCQHGAPGDHLYVRETFMDLTGTGVEHRDSSGQRQRYAFAADSPPGSYGDVARKDYGLKWKPSIHMPRAASRILLEIVSVRVERLNAISENDCWAEGIDACDGLLDDMAIIDCAKRMGRQWEDAAPTFAALWESINGAGSWATNPFIWVLEFKRVTP